MKNCIVVLAFLFFNLVSANCQAQAKESAIIYVLGNHDHDKFKLSLYINGQCLRKDTKTITADEFLELNKVINVLLSKGWRLASTSESVLNAYHYRTVFLERDKEQ